MADVSGLLATASPSYLGCTRLLGKSAGVLVTGFLLTALARYEFSACVKPLDWCLSATGLGLAIAGAIVSTVAWSWLALIGRECERRTFFPSPTLNRLGGWVLTWKVMLGAVAVGFALQVLATGKRVGWEWFIPICLARLTLLTADPTRSKQGFALLFPELADTVSGLCAQYDSKAVFAQVPLYHAFGASQRVVGFLQEQEEVPTITSSKPQLGPAWRLLRIVCWPLRVLVREVLFWGPKRDGVLLTCAVGCLALSYHGCFELALCGAALLLPFVLRSKCKKLLKETRELLHPKELQDFVDQLNPPMAAYLGLVHFFALYGAVVALLRFEPLTQTPVQARTYAVWFVLHCVSGLGITAGVHRLWAHRSYQAHPVVRWALMVCNSFANQGSIWHWARDHIVHHRFSDTPQDPHDSNRGFFFSHIGWLLYKKDPRVVAAGRKVDMSHLRADPAVMFQKALDPWWNFSFCFVVPALMAHAWGESMWTGFLVLGVLRYCVVLHCTWCVNSVVHAFGAKPYAPEHATTEHGLVSLLAFGEGWHNWHHAFDWDYAAAEMGALQQYNPTKVLIDALAAVGLVWGRKRADKVWVERKRKWSKLHNAPVEESARGPPLFRTRVVTVGPEYGDDDE